MILTFKDRKIENKILSNRYLICYVSPHKNTAIDPQFLGDEGRNHAWTFLLHLHSFDEGNGFHISPYLSNQSLANPLHKLMGSHKHQHISILHWDFNPLEPQEMADSPCEWDQEIRTQLELNTCIFKVWVCNNILPKLYTREILNILLLNEKRFKNFL